MRDAVRLAANASQEARLWRRRGGRLLAGNPLRSVAGRRGDLRGSVLVACHPRLNPAGNACKTSGEGSVIHSAQERGILPHLCVRGPLPSGSRPDTVTRVAKAKTPPRSNNDIRNILLRYFYDRNQKATSARGARGVAAKISAIRSDLKGSHGLSQQEIWSNLTYLISQGWVEEDVVKKDVPLPTGTVIPQTTTFYKITAHGIDKIEGPGEFTMDRFKGIRIEATGQNIITVGDGNQVNARHEGAAAALAELRKALVASERVSEPDKVLGVAEIDTIQAQLAKPVPNRTILGAAWEGVKIVATGAGLVSSVANIAKLLGV